MSKRDSLFLGGTIIALVLFIAFMVMRDANGTDAQAQFGGNAVIIYTEPDSNSQPRGSMAQGTVDILAVSDDGLWLQVPFRDTSGWVAINAVNVIGELE